MIIPKWIGSPNFDEGRGGKKIELIVCHWFGLGKLAGVDAVFQNTDRNTSAHYAIEDDVVHQFVSESDTAFHAGVYDINQRSIGIEHSAEPGRDASDETYNTTAELIASLCEKYNIVPSDQTICPHKQFKSTQCPGTLDIDRIIRKVKELMEPETDCSKCIYDWKDPEDNKTKKRGGIWLSNELTNSKKELLSTRETVATLTTTNVDLQTALANSNSKALECSERTGAIEAKYLSLSKDYEALKGTVASQALSKYSSRELFNEIVRRVF